eukprot:scpid104492/ scgid6671/ 
MEKKKEKEACRRLIASLAALLHNDETKDELLFQGLQQTEANMQKQLQLIHQRQEQQQQQLQKMEQHQHLIIGELQVVIQELKSLSTLTTFWNNARQLGASK